MNLVFAAVFVCTTICFGILAWLFFTVMSRRIKEGRGVLAGSLRHQFSTMFLFVDVDLYINLYLASLCLIPTFAWLLTGNLFVGVITFVALLPLPKIYLSMLLKKRLKSFEKQLPDAMMMLSGSLKAGASLSNAVENLVREAPEPLSQEFGLYLRERRLGEDFETALIHMEKRIPLEDFAMCISAIRISREVGGNLAETLEILADTLRRKLTMEGKINSLTAQGKLQGIVMSSLPVLLILVLLRIEPVAMGMMFTTPIGWAVLSLISAMMVLGFLAIRKITTIDV